MRYIRFKNVDWIDIDQPEKVKYGKIWRVQRGSVELNSLVADSGLSESIPIGYHLNETAFVDFVENAPQDAFQNMEILIKEFLIKDENA